MKPGLENGGRTANIFLAAIHIDPHWAKSLLDVVADSPSSSELADRLRFQFVWTLALPLPDRWIRKNDYTAGLFWEPVANDRPLPP